MSFFRRLYPFDYAILGYMALLSVLILIFGRPLSLYSDELLMNLGVIVIVLLVSRFLQEASSRTALFFRLLYPGILFTFFYEQTGGLMKLIFPEFLDYQLTAFEQAIVGVEPSLWLDQNLINVWITEILSFAYFSYYAMLPIFLLALFFLKRYDIIKPALTAISLTFFVSYLLFFLYPIEGPRHYFAGQYMQTITGPIFRPLVDLAISKGAVHGGCMPSSHVGVALVIMVFTMNHYPRTGWFLVPINIGLAMGTVYGRFHYFSDVIVGAAIALTAIWLTTRYYARFDKSSSHGIKSEREAPSYVP